MGKSNLSWCVFLMVMASFISYGSTLHASAEDYLAPEDDFMLGFSEANDSIRLRIVVKQLNLAIQAETSEGQRVDIHEVIQFCSDQKFPRGETAAHLALFRQFSFTSEPDSAAREKAWLLNGRMHELSCANQLTVWILSGANLMESFQTDQALQEYHIALDLADSCDLAKLDVYNGLAAVHESLGQERKAIGYLKMAAEEVFDKGDSLRLSMVYNNLSLMHDALKENDSSLWYIQQAVDLYTHPAYCIRYGILSLDFDDYALAREQFELADSLIGNDPFLQRYRQSLYLGQARLSLKTGNYDTAEAQSLRALREGRSNQMNYYIQTAFHLLIQSKLGNEFPLGDSLEKYKDLVQNEAIAEATVEMETRYESLKKEQEILNLNGELKDKNLRELRTRNYILVAISILLILILLGTIQLRHRQMRTKREVERLRRQAVKLQMNPHFFFNSLNSINVFIAKNEKEAANQYLINFSRLMRLTLENSQEDQVPIEKEIEFLSNYLSLEQLRMKNFDFEFQVEPGLETAKIPSLMIQPLVENSLLHGFDEIPYRGILIVNISREGNSIQVKVKDNGKGKMNTESSKTDSDHKPFALDILRKRIGMYSKGNESVVFDKGIEGGGNPGTQVSFRFPIID